MAQTLFDGPPDAATQEIDILLLPEFSNLTFAALLEPLRAANRAAGQQLYAWRLLSADGGPVASSSGVSLAVDGKLGEGPPPGVVFLVASYNAERAATPQLLAALRRLERRGVQFGGFESGSYALARAGLLDGYRATTHWEDLEDFAQKFPRVETVPDRFVIDRGRFTTGGATPALDFALELIRAQHGLGIALDVGSTFIYDQERLSSDPQQIVSLGRLAWREPKLAEAIQLMEQHIEAPLPVEVIARRAGLQLRGLQRLFRAVFGVTPGDYYQGLRLNAGRRLIQRSDKPVSEIALICGFASPSAFARAFRRRFGMAPGELRRS
ncbi:MAG: GlxA family transcriptional regulator [Rhodovibrionaceae bacterium]